MSKKYAFLIAALVALPALLHAAPSVMMDSIVAPQGTVDSGDIVTPRVVVRNIGTVEVDTAAVHVLIDDELDRVLYHDSLVVYNLPAGTADTLDLSLWVPTARDSVGVLAWVYWEDDVTHRDDTLFSKFLVRALNVGITRVVRPIPDTIPPDTIQPRVRVFNFGNTMVSFPVVFNIGDWSDTVEVVNLMAFGSRFVTAENAWPADTGEWQADFRAELEGDQHPDDNDTAFTFWVMYGAALAEEGRSAKKDVELGHAGPSLFTQSTRLSFVLPKSSQVDLAIFSADGRRVKTLNYGVMDAGRYFAVWDGTNSADSSTSPGIYLAHLEVEGFSSTRKLVKLE